MRSSRLPLPETAGPPEGDSDLFLASPLSLLSPSNFGTTASAAAAKDAPSATAAVTAAQPSALAPRLPPSPRLPMDLAENDPLGELPDFGARRNGRRRPDARRQSLAIGAMFAGLTAGDGLLGDSELAVGDEEIQVPLAKSGKLLGGTANHSSLWCDPDTADLLDTQLPSPQLPSLLGPGAAPDATAVAAAGGGEAPTPELPPLRERQQQQQQQQQEAAEDPMVCDSPVVAPAALAAAASARKTPAGLRQSVAVMGDLSRACLGLGLDDFDGADFQLQESNKVRELAMLYKIEGPAGAGGSSAASTPTATPAVKTGAAAAAHEGQHVQRIQGAAPSAAVPAAVQQPAAARAAQPSAPRSAAKPPAAGTRLPAPQARASRLRPPTTSSGFFSHAATESDRQAARAAPGSKVGPRPTSASSSRAAAAAGGRAPAAAGRSGSAGAAKPQAVSRLVQGGSRIPTPSKPAAPRMAAGGQRSMSSTAAQPCAAATTQQGPSRTPATAKCSEPSVPSLQLGGAAPSAASPAAAVGAQTSPPGSAGLTPNTARLRWLERHPELAFGGGTKLAPSPAGASEAAQPRKLTAEERHLQEWADHL